jgi:hypothetical protein
VTSDRGQGGPSMDDRVITGCSGTSQVPATRADASMASANQLFIFGLYQMRKSSLILQATLGSQVVPALCVKNRCHESRGSMTFVTNSLNCLKV